MKALSNSSDCPNCGSNHKAKPFCQYENGYHCFSCGYTKSYDRGFTPLQDRRASIPDWPDAIADFTKFSVEAQIWLTQYSMTPELVSQYHIHFCDDCLLFPVFQDRELVCYQKRNMKQRFITTYGQKRPYILKSPVTSRTFVVVEDFISAIRVHQAGFNALCLFGTKLPYEDLRTWFKVYDYCLVWLDNDYEKQTNSGQEAAAKLVKMGQSIIKNEYGLSNCKEIVNIVAELDPKCFSNKEVQELVRQGAIHG